MIRLRSDVWRRGLAAGAVALMGAASVSLAVAQTTPEASAQGMHRHAMGEQHMAHAGGGHGMGMHHGKGQGMHEGLGGKMGAMGHGRALDRVGATAEQKSRINDIFKAVRTELASQRDAMRALHQQMAQAFAQPVVDARAVEALRQQISTQRDAMSKRMTQAMVDASTVLTPEQRQKLAEMQSQRRQMHERHRMEMRQLDNPRS